MCLLDSAPPPPPPPNVWDKTDCVERLDEEDKTITLVKQGHGKSLQIPSFRVGSLDARILYGNNSDNVRSQEVPVALKKLADK